ncbi:MAG: glycosyltransferase family 4 protein [Candidatus Krumholzibacteriota bacterium]
MRLGLKKHGAYTNVSRAERLTKTLASADKVISLGPAIGRYTFDTYTKMLGPDKVLPLENIFSISVDEFTGLAGNRTPREETDEITFLHVSHINLIKGIPYLLDAWRSFQERSMTSCRLVLVGSADKNILDLLEQDYSDLAGFEYRGFMPNLVEAYSYGDVFVSPSISDNGPGTIVEAMAAGMPVISSRNCGLSSLVTEGENGFTYEYNDTEKLTQALIWFANNRHMICDMGRNARQTAENLTGDHYADEILEHVEKLSKMEPEASDSKPMG